MDKDASIDAYVEEADDAIAASTRRRTMSLSIEQKVVSLTLPQVD